MIELLPNELLWSVLHHLNYEEIKVLFAAIPSDRYSSLAHCITCYLKHHYPFQTSLSTSLYQFEQECLLAHEDVYNQFAQHLLTLICDQVEPLSPYDRRPRFTELLDILQRFILHRVMHLSDTMEDGSKKYAQLCLVVRDIYLHTPSIRVLHDPKYRRRSTKHPLAPFLPRDYSYMWRKLCSENDNKHHHRHRRKHQGFALFFGRLFDVTSLYLESNLEGTFEECIREGLVTGNAEDVLMVSVAAGREIDVEGMCMMVTVAGEQLRHYLDTIDHWVTQDPTPQQELRMRQQHREEEAVESSSLLEEITSPPDWLIPDRYKVHPDTKLRLKLMSQLYNKGWRWF